MQEVAKEQEPLSRKELASLDSMDIRCSLNNRIGLICSDENCKKAAFMCCEDNCKACYYLHLSCLGSIRLKTLTHHVTDICRRQLDLISTLDKIENAFIDRVREQRRLMQKQLTPFPHILLKQINQIYCSRRVADFSGHQCKAMVEALKQQSSLSSSQKMDSLCKRYRLKIQGNTQQLLRLRRMIIAKYCGLPASPSKQHKEGSQENLLATFVPASPAPRLQSIRQPQKAKSLLQQFTKSEYQFLVSSLPAHKQIKLVYRASQHGFKAKAFHQHCDNLLYTLTILKNQFSKIIAGYSAYSWNAANNYFVQDSSPTAKDKAFLLSIAMKKKFKPTHKQNLVFCYSGYGPVFGQGPDLCIADECHKNLDSYANFPTTFESPKINYGPETNLKFSGAKEDNRFAIQEYEVYQVLMY